MGIGVCVGTCVAIGREIDSRVFVGWSGRSVVRNERVGSPEAVNVGESVGVAVAVGVGTYCEITSTVNDAIVLRLLKAESTMF